MSSRRLTPAVEQLINERVAAAIAAYEAARSNGGEGSGNAVGGQGSISQGCSYRDFRHCKPTNFGGTEGAVGLIRWFKKMETVFRISNCAENDRVKFATCTLFDAALTWWNSYAQSVGLDAAYAISWEEFRQMMTEEYCPRNELQKLESELWNLKVNGTDLIGYTTRFQELSVLCPRMVTPEYVKIERYIEGLPSQIKGNVTASNPTTIQAAIRMANKLMDQAVQQGTMTRNAEGKGEGKRKWNEDQERSSVQYPNKRQEIVEVDNTGRGYKGKLPYCAKCDMHHTGRCTIICTTCNRVGHKAKDCKIATPVPITVVPMTCYECGETGHFKRNCPKLKRQNIEGNVYMITNGEDHQDLEQSCE